MIVSVDGLTRIRGCDSCSIQAEIKVYVHQIRYSTKFISYKDLKPFYGFKAEFTKLIQKIFTPALESGEKNETKNTLLPFGSWRNIGNYPHILSIHLRYVN